MRAFWVFVIISAACIGWFSSGTPIKPSVLVPDVSWPNCNATLTNFESGIVGVTGGLALRPNKCLTSEAGLFKKVSVYVNTGYPGTKKASKFQNFPKKCARFNDKCLAYNYGYNSGLYDINYSLKSGVIAKHWWLDVETENSWSDTTKVNRQALQGTLDAISKFAGNTNVGFYSYPGQWNLITGNWRNHYPAWVATGTQSFTAAKQACVPPSFTGGPIIYGQYTPALDANFACAHY